MSMLDEITVLVLTYNEEHNIARTLGKLSWAKRILVVDSGSTDGTRGVLDCYPQVEEVHRTFDSFAGQCNFGLSLIDSPWILSIDADYELSDQLIDEIKNLDPSASVAGYRVGFIYRVFGRSLRGTLYPPRIVLYRRGKARYRDEGHGHRVVIDGAVADLGSKIYHDDRKPLDRWFASQRSYAIKEADFLLNTPSGGLRPTDRVRRMAWPAPILVFFYALVVKRCFLDGRPGWHYVLQRVAAETLIALEVVDRRLRSGAITDRNRSGV